jgi:hypothetical protein
VTPERRRRHGEAAGDGRERVQRSAEPRLPPLVFKGREEVIAVHFDVRQNGVLEPAGPDGEGKRARGNDRDRGGVNKKFELRATNEVGKPMRPGWRSTGGDTGVADGPGRNGAGEKEPAAGGAA